MDIYGYIKKDHRRFEDLMEQVEKARTTAKRLDVFRTLKAELIIHAKAEEQSLYAAMDKATRSKAVEKKLDHTTEEHDEIEGFLKQISAASPSSDQWMIHFGELKHACAHHFEEEEGTLFEKAKGYFDAAQARQLAKDMDALKREMMADA
ncbi:hemerythrin domain-containing protein [Asticcacaulis sp. YBE204]|uniref:hemerythrin domain-containing protein n=1 Tax=Asticcacaulis sp. YBE204 TaxID=1282363 RepID=UPI0003C3CDCA|nr:hemerythrin domain-containing protein [Asticcacaulis sp. YBE204]ESQ77788.1 hypothetical protein AEYBE204_16800 [Asticcacaulis sp. YBE204]